MSKTESARLERKLRQQSGVTQPTFSRQCWAEKRIYTGALFPAFVNCSKPARKGHLTCHWHADREAEAQSMKTTLERKREGA